MKCSRPAGRCFWAAAIRAGQSCVAVVRTGDVHDVVPSNPGDWNGGPGTTMATLYYFDRQNNKSPMADFNWHQTRLKTYLQNEAATNAEASRVAHDLAEQAMAFSETANTWPSVPMYLAAIDYSATPNGPATAWRRFGPRRRARAT